MGCGHKIILLEGMFYIRTFLMGGYVLLEGMSYGRICLIGGHVLLVPSFEGEHTLEECISYRMVFLWRI